MDASNEEVQISLRVHTLAQLFHSLDPSPFREKELDAQAEEFIVGWAQDAAKDAPFAIIVHLPAAEAERPDAADVPFAITSNFEYRAEQARRNLRELLREGQYALLVGVPLLGACLLASQLITRYAEPTTLARLMRESLLILGWVANWRPLEIFLYAWWPIRRRKRLYERLARARVEVRAD